MFVFDDSILMNIERLNTNFSCFLLTHSLIREKKFLVQNLWHNFKESKHIIYRRKGSNNQRGKNEVNRIIFEKKETFFLSFMKT